MKKPSLRSRALAPAVVLAVGALVATPALAQVGPESAETSESTPTPTPTEAATTEASETAPNPSADDATDQSEPGDGDGSGEQAESTQPAEEETAESTPEASEEASPEATEDPSTISPTVRMDYPLPAQKVHDEGIEVRVKTAPNAPVDITKTSVMFTGGYTLQLPDEWDGTADDNGDYVFTIAPDTPITTTFKPEERNTTVGQLRDGDGVVVQIRSNGKSTSYATEVQGTAEEAKPTVTFPDHPDNAATRTIGKDFKTKVAYTGATPGDTITVVINGTTRKHGDGTYEAPATVAETDGEFEVSLPASFLDEVHSGTADDQDVLQVRVGSTRNHVRITEEAAAKPTVSFPNNPDGTAERKAGESISVKVRYEDVKTGDPISVVANGEVLTHGEGYQSIQKTDYVRGGFFVRLDGEFLDTVRADGEPERDTVEVRVGEGSATLDILEIADEPTEEPTEDPEEISPTVRMDYPLPAQKVHDEGIEVRVKTAPNAPVDITKTSVMFTGGYTLQLPDSWDGTADDNGDYVFTIAPDTPITTTFKPEERNTTVGQLTDGDRITVQVRTNGKNTSYTTQVEGTAQEAKPTVTFPDHPDNAATRTIGDDFTARVAYTGATAGDPVTVIVNGYTQKHGEGTFEAPATVTETDGEFEVTLPASFLDEVHSGTADDQDVLQVRVGSTRNHVRITEEPTEEPTDDPTEDPTDQPTEDPTEDPTDEPTEEPTEDPTDQPTGEPTDDPTEDPTDEPTENPTGEPTDDSTDQPTDDPTDDGDDDKGDDQADELALSISPDRITASEFVDSERGVILSVTGLEPGDDIEFAVAPTSGQNVDPADLSATATEDGVASTVVYGTSSIDPASYIGDYSVAVSGIDEDAAQAGSETVTADAAAQSADDLTGTFTVTTDDGGSGDGGSDHYGSGDHGSGDGGSDRNGSDDGGQLPRTGAELGALAAGAALLAVGGAAVVISRRRFDHGA